MRFPPTLAVTLLAGVLAGCIESESPEAAANAASRDQVRVVGSSTVYPFASYVAEELGATTAYPTPVVESTGSGGGIKIFCAGNGINTPDVTNASRPMKAGELERCRDNGVAEVTEAMFGFDGIVLGQAAANPALALTLEQITLAVAAEVPENGELVANPYERWSEIDPSLPDREILVYGPPTSSGTRDAFDELVVEAATEEMPGYPESYTRIRQDGRFVPSGENDNLIVQKIEQNRQAVGIFGYSFLEENAGRIRAASIDGIEPTPENISAGTYPVSRSLFFYVKNSHIGRVAGLDAYVELFMSERMISPDGFLTDLGLIPLPPERRQAVRERVSAGEPLEMEDLQ